MQQRLRTWLVGAVLIALGAAVGYLVPRNTVSPKSEVGHVMSVTGGIGSPNAGFEFKASKGATGLVHYKLEDPIPWQATPNGAWHTSGQPTCLQPGSTTPVKVTLGAISVDAVGSAPGGSMVVWIECYPASS